MAENFRIYDKMMYINGKYFEVKRQHLNNDDLAEIAYSTKSLRECYNRPSLNKMHIYDHWKTWYNGVPSAFYFGVSSYNNNFFSLKCIIENVAIDGIGVKDIVIHITPYHNYAIIAK